MPYRPTAFEIVWKSPWVRALTYLAAILLVLWLLITYRGQYAFALQVGIIGFVVAYVLNPVVNALQRIKVRRAVGVVIVYLVLLNVIVLGSVLITEVVSELGNFINLIPEALSNIANLTGNISAWAAQRLESLPDFLSDRLGINTNEDVAVQIQDQFATIVANATESITNVLENLVREGPAFLLSGATTIISATLQVFLILLASAYFLYDFPRFTEAFRRIVPTRWRELYDDLSSKADKAVGGYLRGQLLITLILGVFIYIGLSIIGVPLALAISFLAALFNLVPYLGPIIGVIPAVLLGFTVSPLTALLAVVVFLVANQLEGNVLAPYILSKSTNLHPVTVLLAILVGAGMFGLLGALLAVPVVALGKVILEEYLFTRPAYQTIPEGVTLETVPTEPDTKTEAEIDKADIEEKRRERGRT